MRGDEVIDQDRGHPPQGRATDAVLQAAQGRRRGHGGRGVGAGMIGGELPERIVAQALVVVEVFVAAGDAEDALRSKRALRVGDEDRVPRVGDGRVQGVEEAEPAVGLAEQKHAGVGGDDAAREVGGHRPAFAPGNRQCVSVARCHRDGSWLGREVAVLTPSCTKP